jgi:hypothetical protein
MCDSVFSFSHEQLHLMGQGHPIESKLIRKRFVLKNGMLDRWSKICVSLLHGENPIMHDITGDET